MQTPYISKVFHYLPAPGQFVNKLPKYEDGDTQEVMNLKAEALIAGEKNELVTLGGWGGCIVFGFDHTIVNVAGKRDFRILGNAFGANANPRPDPPFGGSCEPGIIMVAYDKNKNGKPDEDEWYEIRGSGNMTAEGEPWYQIAKDKGQDVATYRNYEMTYFRPTSETPQEAGEIDNPGSFTTIKEYIRWKDNQGKEGYKIKNVYHDQSYYPGWIKDDQITYKGIRIADNGISEKEDGSYYVLYAYRYGYVDNFPNLDARSAIDIDWAVDKNGNKVHLPGIDFVKVYNGVDKENGWLGEASTEVAGGQDLHMLGEDVDTIEGI
ncbi:PKD domain-containing protein [Bacteroides pyogenes]|nr:PKD domain-containing protein [Bacteroides pyogenes]